MLDDINKIKSFVNMIDAGAPVQDFRRLGISRNDIKYHIRFLATYRDAIAAHNKLFGIEGAEIPIQPIQPVVKVEPNHYADSGLFGPLPNNYAGNWKELIDEIIDKKIELSTLLNIGVGGGLSALKWNTFIYKMLDLEHITNLEMESSFVKKAISTNNPLLLDTKQGVAQDALSIFGPRSFDVVFWSHGPEHILRSEWKDTFEVLEKVSRKIVILQCPWGSGYDDNSEHVSPSIQSGEFEKFGYTVRYDGKKDTRSAGILSVKYINELGDMENEKGL